MYWDDEMTILNDLPHEHPLRNTPLARINAQHCWKHSKVWSPIEPSFGIAKKTFNDLSGVWTDNDYFGVNE